SGRQFWFFSCRASLCPSQILFSDQTLANFLQHSCSDMKHSSGVAGRCAAIVHKGFQVRP
ncbi:MAG TPA: hypothetical protein VHE37_07520, partial [Nevskiaceae bacterium]|nr:hypothetical protein [Nevskiaceae bacterium]